MLKQAQVLASSSGGAEPSIPLMAKEAAHENFERDDPKVGSERTFGFVFRVVFTLIALWPLIWARDVRLLGLGDRRCFSRSRLIRAALLRPLNLAGSGSGSSCITLSIRS